jgi:hypothetical protein
MDNIDTAKKVKSINKDDKERLFDTQEGYKNLLEEKDN